MSRRKVTMQQIAHTAGVSKYVVSKTLNGKPGVSDKTRQKILFVAKQLGYFKNNENVPMQPDSEPNDHTSFVLGVIPNRHYENQSSYWGKIIEGLSDGVHDKNWGLVIVTEEQPFKDMINTKGVKGIICVGHISTEMMLDLQQLHVPMVLVDHEDPLIAADSVFIDNYDGTYKLTKHLVTIGHENVLFVGDIGFASSFYDRFLGYRTALEQAGLQSSVQEPLKIAYTDQFAEQFSNWIEEEKGNQDFPTAFVCANDDIAQRVLETLHQHHIRVPEECSVTGFDNLDISLYTEPPLSTVQVLKEAIGKRAVEKLFWRFNHADFPIEKILIRGEIIIRRSVASK
ncbi:LacI family DNA-binding transcriptional regulator [Evansella cellulosilytica]|uniref:Transcriptional regulator, LacI family n=1 Tax=Evansella cellulosilytica (strain ATCC 21833 / DSM 2522 / FERM P-1141 / JCM 9156 / N-4) TaxID=649639 RepID=E6U1W2_EVAC2|nr:LacI family DNA-binding transcriptional regulator [Evansella cellulosilytica]ADU31609.1 transcriptional regulator, LacI family [Evansella cellulosilytica DSM 2522]